MERHPYNPTESDERSHLVRVRTRIKAALDEIGEKVNAQFADVIELKKYLHESRADMDHVEKISVRQSIEQLAMVGDHAVARKGRLAKLYKSPYFGRIDFKEVGAAEPYPAYIGIHSFYDEAAKAHLVHDWRAPISSMFYDYELGPAGFDAPEGRKEGELALKRQYRIEKGELVFMLETSLNIQDALLQEELSRASSDQMRNIVATIQRDQNAIIRDDATHTLIIQGAAGSGKTSIALHRIAYLLYKFKDAIRSEDILIISPNKVFAHYISHVLPELGEEMIKETTMEALAEQLLGHKVRFQSFAEQVAAVIEDPDGPVADRIRFKSTPAFLSKLEAFAQFVRQHNLTAKDVPVGRRTVPAVWIEDRFRACGLMPIAQQINEVTEAIVERARMLFGIQVDSKERASIRRRLLRMFSRTELKDLYELFYAWMGALDKLVSVGRGKYEYADVFPMLYLKILLEGIKPDTRVKHLVIDEMQDYTPVQYRVIAHLFPCRKTILGDHHQSVNPISASPAEVIQQHLPQSRCMYMHKSYRSTVEIMALAQRIRRNENLVTIDRHGEPPEIVACRDAAHEREVIRERVERFLASGRNAMGIICKTQAVADALYAELHGVSRRIHHISPKSAIFSGGVVIATAHLAKGLEFDEVLVPFAGAENYKSQVDRHLLYVACTRAMHALCLTHTGALTPFLSGGES